MMMTSREMRKNLEDTVDMLTSDYTPDQWKNKKKIDLARYTVAKSVYDEVNDAISFDKVIWDYSSDEDYDAISQLMDKLYCEIDMMEEDLNI